MIHSSERLPAWQGCGTNIEGLGIEEGMRAAGIDFRVGIAPLVAAIPSPYGYKTPDGELIHTANAVPGYQVTYREDTGAPIAPVGGRYHVVQTLEAVNMVEVMTLTGWSPVFGGALRGGRSVFMAGVLDVALQTKEVSPYLCFVNSFDGSSGIKFTCTPMRPACTNMVRAIFRKKSARPVVSLRHTSKALTRIDSVREILKLTHSYYRFLDDEIDKLLNTTVTPERMEQVLDVVAPLVDKGKPVEGRVLEGRIEKRNLVTANLSTSPTIPNSQRGTAWGLYNAVTELEQWGRDVMPTSKQTEQLLGSHLSVVPVRMTSDRVYRVMDRWLQPA